MGVTSELMFHPEYPYKSSFLERARNQFCDAYEKASGKQWTQPIGGLSPGTISWRMCLGAHIPQQGSSTKGLGGYECGNA